MTGQLPTSAKWIFHQKEEHPEYKETSPQAATIPCNECSLLTESQPTSYSIISMLSDDSTAVKCRPFLSNENQEKNLNVQWNQKWNCNNKNPIISHSQRRHKNNPSSCQFQCIN